MLHGGNKSAISSVNVELFPNPVTKNLNIHINHSNHTINKIEIYDIYGKLLHTAQASGAFVDLDVSDLAAGIYVVHILTDKGSINKKFVKQ